MTKTKKIVLAIVGGAIVSLAPVIFHPKPVRAQNGTASLGVNGWQCVVTVSTQTTIQAVGNLCVAPTITGVRHYITDITFATNAAGIAADSFPTLKSGTGGTCGSNTAVIWQAFTTAATQATVVQDFTTPIKLPVNSEICWIESTAGSKTITLEGYDGL